MDQPDASLDFLEGIDLSQNAPDDASVLSEPVDFKALLLRRFAWDSMPCNLVEALLPHLGLTIGTPEGLDHEHAESHHRMAAVFPYEHLLRDYAMILSTVLSTAITEAQGVADAMSPADQIGFVRQNAELILSGSRSVLAQLFFSGLATYGPLVQIHPAHVDADGNIVLDDLPAEGGELPGQLSFDDVAPDE